MNTNIMTAQRQWELSKFSDEELREELKQRKQAEIAELYAKKDVIAYCEITGEPYDTEKI